MKTKLPGVLVLLLCTASVVAQTRPSSDEAIAQAQGAVDRNVDQFKQRQFIAFDSNYLQEKKTRGARLSALAKEVFARESAGKDVRVPHQILIETYWLYSATADFKRFDQRLDDLAKAMASPTTGPATNGDPTGLAGLTVYYFQLDAAYDQLDLNTQYPFPRELLDRINSPQKLRDYFDSVSVSDIAHQGIDHEEEQNEPLADLTRLILRGRPENYTFDPNLKDALLEMILHRLRDPVTGYWGERYIVDGRAQFIPDLSTTFHVVSYLEDNQPGTVPDLDKIVVTTLALRDRDTPVGWLHQGQQYNHNSMDVIDLFKRAWPHVDARLQHEIAAEVPEMIRRCLDESLQPDGSFKHITADSSVEEATYFGASFLVRAGFFDKSEQFWGSQDFPQSAEVRLRIIGFIKKNQSSGATGGGFYNSALKQLHYDSQRDG